MKFITEYGFNPRCGKQIKRRERPQRSFSMNKNKIFLLGVLALGLVLAGCGGSNPKSLAKQTYDIGLQAVGAMFDPAKAAELEKKVEDIEKKVAKLSGKDRAIYDEELARLGEDAAEALGGLFKAATDAAGSTQGVLQEAADAADSAAEALRSLGF
jgi:hypothetical protein